MSFHLSLACFLVRNGVARLRSLLASTCWRNEDALACVLSAATLVLHGCHVNRASLVKWTREEWDRLSCHISSTAPSETHTDMGVYFSDDEIRQPDLLSRALVVGPESPDTGRCMTEEVFKRHISANPVARNLPCAVLTKMVSLTRSSASTEPLRPPS